MDLKSAFTICISLTLAAFSPSDALAQTMEQETKVLESSLVIPMQFIPQDGESLESTSNFESIGSFSSFGLRHNYLARTRDDKLAGNVLIIRSVTDDSVELLWDFTDFREMWIAVSIGEATEIITVTPALVSG